MSLVDAPVDAPVVKMPEPLPVDYQSSKENSLLLKILQNIENDSELKIVQIDLTTPCKIGDNYMSVIKRATVCAEKSDGKTIRKCFIIKIQHMDDATKYTLDIDSVWANEEYMYKCLFPAMKSVTKGELSIPEYYFSDPDIVILEDLGSKGYAMCNRVKGLDFDHSIMVLNRLAHFHAASLALHCKNPEVFNRFRESYLHVYHTEQNRNKTLKYLVNNFNNAIDILKKQPEYDTYKNGVDFLEVVSRDIDKIIPVLQKPPSGNTCVLTHGDLWINNILFLQDPNSHKPIDVKFVDFQGTRVGSVAIDLYHFIYTSVKPEIRQNHLNKFLIYYHKCLMEYFNDFTEGDGESFIQDFKFEKLLDEMRHYRIYGLINAILLMPVLALDPEQNSFNFLNSPNGCNSKTHASKLIDLIMEYKQRNWINFNFEY